MGKLLGLSANCEDSVKLITLECNDRNLVKNVDSICCRSGVLQVFGWSFHRFLFSLNFGCVYTC